MQQAVVTQLRLSASSVRYWNADVLCCDVLRAMTLWTLSVRSCAVSCVHALVCMIALSSVRSARNSNSSADEGSLSYANQKIVQIRIRNITPLFVIAVDGVIYPILSDPILSDPILSTCSFPACDYTATATLRS